MKIKDLIIILANLDKDMLELEINSADIFIENKKEQLIVINNKDNVFLLGDWK